MRRSLPLRQVGRSRLFSPYFAAQVADDIHFGRYSPVKLYFFGHDYKYAAEQMLLTLFPLERPEYPSGKPEGDRMELRLSRGARYITATCALHCGGEVFRGRAAVRAAMLDGALLTDRYCQRLIKNAMYRAALASGVRRPAWGALTGVRPGKLMTPLLKSGMSGEAAVREFEEKYDVSPERAALCLQTSRVTLAAEASLAPEDVCLYVGIPFCPTRCAYCSFVSQSVEKSMQLIDPFVAALFREIRATAAEVRALGLRAVSVYMGGGTPTTLSAAQLDALCALLAEEFDLSALREYTVEAGRPDTITEEKLAVLRRHGVDRISVNPQTMSDAVLEVMKFIYDHIMYAELNTKSDYCQVCGFDGEIEIKEDEDGKLIWVCPQCGNTDQSKMNVARRTCGYIGTQYWNQGRTQEIRDRVLHL